MASTASEAPCKFEAVGKGLLVELTGQRFGKLVVLRRAPNRPYDRRARWHCRCECGNETEVRGAHLRAKTRATVSCGCYGRVKSITHGHSRNGKLSRTYIAWKSMLQRCTDPSSTSYRHYGGRGIAIAAHWLLFDNFLADMGVCPPGMTLDRRKNNGNYEASNCRWLTRVDQNRNRSLTRLTVDAVQEIHGRCEHGESQRSVAKRLGISETLLSQVRRGHIWADQLGGPS